MSRVLVEDHQVVSQTSRISWSRVTTRPAVPDQDPEQVELLGRELELLVAHPGAVRLDVDPYAVGRGGDDGLAGAAPEQGPDPGEELGEAEGLGDVVVGARVEPDDGVDLVRPRGEDQDRDRVALGAQPPGDLQAVHAGQPQVEYDQVHAALESGVEGGRTVLADLDLVPLSPQGTGQRFRDGCVVLGEQYTGHGVMVVRTATGPWRDPFGPGDPSVSCGHPVHDLGMALRGCITACDPSLKSFHIRHCRVVWWLDVCSGNRGPLASFMRQGPLSA